jgi:hypothetical protein
MSEEKKEGELLGELDDNMIFILEGFYNATLIPFEQLVEEWKGFVKHVCEICVRGERDGVADDIAFESTRDAEGIMTISMKRESAVSTLDFKVIIGNETQIRELCVRELMHIRDSSKPYQILDIPDRTPEGILKYILDDESILDSVDPSLEDIQRIFVMDRKLMEEKCIFPIENLQDVSKLRVVQACNIALVLKEKQTSVPYFTNSDGTQKLHIITVTKKMKDPANTQEDPANPKVGQELADFNFRGTVIDVKDKDHSMSFRIYICSRRNMEAFKLLYQKDICPARQHILTFEDNTNDVNTHIDKAVFLIQKEITLLYEPIPKPIPAGTKPRFVCTELSKIIYEGISNSLNALKSKFLDGPYPDLMGDLVNIRDSISAFIKILTERIAPIYAGETDTRLIRRSPYSYRFVLHFLQHLHLKLHTLIKQLTSIETEEGRIEVLIPQMEKLFLPDLEFTAEKCIFDEVPDISSICWGCGIDQTTKTLQDAERRAQEEAEKYSSLSNAQKKKTPKPKPAVIPSIPVKFAQCGRCMKVSYCCRECQTEDWNKQHKFECKGFNDDKIDELEVSQRSLLPEDDPTTYINIVVQKQPSQTKKKVGGGKRRTKTLRYKKLKKRKSRKRFL